VTFHKHVTQYGEEELPRYGVDEKIVKLLKPYTTLYQPGWNMTNCVTFDVHRLRQVPYASCPSMLYWAGSGGMKRVWTLTAAERPC